MTWTCIAYPYAPLAVYSYSVKGNVILLWVNEYLKESSKILLGCRAKLLVSMLIKFARSA